MGYKSQPTVTRPANITAYTGGDVVGGVITFAELAATNEKHMRITAASLRIDVAAVPVGMGAFKLHLYSATPPSAIADNAAWDLPAGDRASYLGFIDLTLPVDLGSTLFTQADGLSKQVQLPAGGKVFGYLVTVAGYTPAANSEVYVPCLCAVDC